MIETIAIYRKPTAISQLGHAPDCGGDGFRTGRRLPSGPDGAANLPAGNLSSIKTE